MDINFKPYARIIIRVAAGYILGDRNNPELEALLLSPEIVAGLALLMSEGWYLMAKRFGGAT